MAIPTYTLINETVLGSTATSVTFSSVPQTYKNLVLEFTGNIDGSAYPRIFFNSVSTSTYSSTNVIGYGSGTYTANLQNNAGAIIGGYFNYWPNSTTVVATNTVNIFSYTDTNIYKSFISRDSATSCDVAAYAGLWRSTAAITSVAVSMGSVNFRAGSTFRLYGLV